MSRPASTLSSEFDPRRNSLTVLRLVLAGIVAVGHALLVGFGHQPALGRTNLADYAVDAFFVVSGFLVAGSYLRLRSFRRYAWHRFLRIMPGFWVCLVVTAVVVAPLAAALSGAAPWTVFTAEEDPAWQYPVVNAALPILQYEIAGLSTDVGETALDGSLWTLQYEAACYALVALLGLFALLHRRAPLVVLAVTAWLLALLENAALIPVDVPVFSNQELFRLTLFFLLGAAAFVHADRVPIRGRWALLATGTVLAGAFMLDDYHLVGAVGFAYLCLYAVVRLPLRQNPGWDFSYGLYIYHWPVEFLLALAGATALGEATFVLLSLVLALVAAAASWYVVEHPALQLKDAAWVDRSRTGHARPRVDPRVTRADG
ncbi:acyltransferase family protein [Modestobacter sp. SYSU DS0657]